MSDQQTKKFITKNKDGEKEINYIIKGHCNFVRNINPLKYQRKTMSIMNDCTIVETRPGKIQGGTFAHCDYCAKGHVTCCITHESSGSLETYPRNFKHYYCTEHLREFEKIKSNNDLAVKIIRNEISTKSQKLIIEGYGVSPGIVKGKIGENIFLLEDQDWNKITELNMLKRGVGLICKTGGSTSHLSIVCRELGKPCIIKVDLDKLHNGDVITMDGSTGKITKDEN